jgi:hypothetical protein
MAYKFNPLTGQLDFVGSAGAGGADALVRSKYVRTTRFSIIGAGTSGTLTLPTNSEVVLDDFGGTTDAVLAKSSGGKPLLESAVDSTGEDVAVSLDIAGNWSFTGTPTAYPVAIVYRVRQLLSDFDSDATDIWGPATVETDDSIVIDLFPASGTWTKPDRARLVQTILLGGGGGGASARMDAAGTVRCGGGGGGGAVLATRLFDADSLGATETVTVGAGGAGGASRSNVGDGAAGTKGGDTTFGTWLKALGGNGGSGGTSSSGNGAAQTIQIGSPWNTVHRGGANASSTGTNGSAGGTNDAPYPTGGGGGGGLTAANVEGLGGAGGAITANVADILAMAGGLAGNAAPANGGNGNSAAWFFGFGLGTGGGGSRGSANNTISSGNGGAGGPGAGGGGAGAATTGGTAATGVGGSGGNGWAVVITYR